METILTRFETVAYWWRLRIEEHNARHRRMGIWSEIPRRGDPVPPTSEQLDRFETALIVRLTASDAAGPLSVDYDPDPMLDLAMVAAGYTAGRNTEGDRPRWPPCMWPGKVRMIIAPDSVSVKDGYAAHWSTIWREPRGTAP